MTHGRWVLAAAAILFVSGCMVAGTISAISGSCVALLAFGLLTGSLHRLVPAGAVAGAVAALAFWPVIGNRLAGSPEARACLAAGRDARPISERFFLPELLSDNKWLFGVRPAPRVPAPEAWREMVYIESGYVWLIWIGGIPFLLAFLWFAAFALRRLARSPARAPMRWAAPPARASAGSRPWSC